MPTEQTRFANLALGLDAALCSAAGLIFTLTGAFMSDWLGAKGWILTVLGVAVMFWSLVITLYANRRITRRPELDRVVKGNALWLGLAAIAYFTAGSLTDAGRTMLLLSSLIVLIFIVAQLLARRTLEGPAPEPAATEGVSQ